MYSSNMADGQVWFASRLFLAIFSGILLAKGIHSSNMDICTYRMKDGSIISLWGLDKGSRYSVSTKPSKADPIGYTYSWRPCHVFSVESSACQSVLMCQKQTTNPRNAYPIAGNHSRLQENKTPPSIIYAPKITLKKSRQLQLNLICEPRSKKPTLGFKEEKKSTGKNPITYVFELHSKCACSNQKDCQAVPPAPGNNKISDGTILLITFTVILLVYLIAGAMFNKLCRGANSFDEIFPNYEFWGSLPGLIKDGCIFSFTKVKYCFQRVCDRDNSYTQI